MAKLMIVTVGTSLFQSASWDKEHDDFKDILRRDRNNTYNLHWSLNEEKKGLRSPEYRKRNDGGLEELFRNEITYDNAARWAEWVAPYDASQKILKMRYSSELATILSFAESAKTGAQSWPDFLRGYEIYFVHDDDDNAPTKRAAQHNCVYLRKCLGDSETTSRIQCWGIADFSGDMPQKLIDGLQRYQKFLQDARFDARKYETIDVVISGGYKVYGLAGYGFLLDERFRVVYLHEELLEAVVQDKNKLKIGETWETPFTAIIES